jgi:DNA mismatch repair protein MutS2
MVTTHLGDLKTYAFHNEHAENGAVEFDDETLRPTYRLSIGQFGMSNALKIARRLKLPKQLLQRAHKYLRRRQRRAPEMMQLQKMRAEAEKAREEALEKAHEAEKQAEDLRRKAEQVEREAAEAAALREARLRLQPGDSPRRRRCAKPGCGCNPATACACQSSTRSARWRASITSATAWWSALGCYRGRCRWRRWCR